MSSAIRAQSVYAEAWHKAAELHRGQLQEARQRARVLEVPTLAQPMFLSMEDRALFANAAERTASALHKVVRAFLSEGRFTEHAPLAREKRRLVHLDSDPMGFWRFDALYDRRSRTLWFLECNGGDPSGMGWVDRLLEAFVSLPAMRDVQQAMPVHLDWLAASHRNVLLGGGGAPEPIAFVCAQESFVRSDHDCLAALHREAGLDVLVGDPREFEETGEGVTLDGTTRRILFRDTIDEFLFPPHAEAAQRIVRAYERGQVKLHNPFCAAVTDFKALFEVLSRPDHRSMFTAEEQAALTRHVPWTRRLVDGAADRDGQSVDLLEFARIHRESLVLKPNDGYGGFGVQIGLHTSAEAWESTLQNAANGDADCIVQDAIPLPVEPLLSVDGSMMHPMVTVSLWVHAGRFVGSFARAASSPVINVHQGGGIMPVVFVGDPA